MSADALRSRAGRILYRELPEEYRYRDNPPSETELGDLEAYLHGFGHVLDHMRNTIEQAHADSFAEPLPDGRGIQPWVLPYLAELLGAELTAPDPKQRAAELNNAVAWYKSKGTLASVDSVGDVVAGAETVAREGWRHVATTPRIGLPPFTLPKERFEAASDAMTQAMQPQGTPDFLKLNRPVKDDSGSNPLFRLKASRTDPSTQDTYWKQSDHGGVPCFPLSYSDTAPRTPDMRDPALTKRIGPHPRRTLIHVRPPDGMFYPGLTVVEMSPSDFRDAVQAGGMLSARDLTDGSESEVLLQIGAKPDTMPANPTTRSFELTNKHLILEGIRLISGNGAKVRLRLKKNSQLTLLNTAVQEISCDVAGGPEPALDAVDSIFDSVLMESRAARLEYCTVIEEITLARIQASDCIFPSLNDTLICPDPKAEGPVHAQNCVRFSRVAPENMTKRARRCLDTLSVSNTTQKVFFVDRWFEDGDDCIKREARYGEAGYGVLDTDTGPAVTMGAEDEGEMGAGHRLHHAAALAALLRKLKGFLPLGQEIAIFYDPTLSHMPPVLKVEKTD